MLFKKFNFQTINRTNSVVILCAGPSLKRNKDRVKKYIKENSSVVLSANYNYFDSFGIKSDYTYITDQMKLFENLPHITSPLIIPVKMKTDSSLKNRVKVILRRNKGDTIEYIRRKGSQIPVVYIIGDKRKNTVYSEKNLAYMDKHGNFPYVRLGSAGQGCVLLSMVFKPKKILIVGMDGSVTGDISRKEMYDGKIVSYASEGKYKDVLHYLIDILFPSIANYGLLVESFEDVGFYNIDKQKLGIKII